MPIEPLPWNRLGISVFDVMEGKHYRGSAADVSFALTKIPPFFKTVPFRWSALKYRNALIMGSADPRWEIELQRFIGFYWTSGVYDTTAFLIDRKNQWEHFDTFEKQGFARVKYTGTFPQLLEDLVKLRDDIVFRLRYRHGVPPFQVFLLPMDASDLSSLVQLEEAWKNFSEVLSKMRLARMFLWVIVDGPGVLPDKLCKFFDIQVFYGLESSEYAVTLHPQAELSRHDPYRKTIGLGWSSFNEGVLHRLSALGRDNLSEWGRKQQSIVETDEEELYRRYLETLKG